MVERSRPAWLRSTPCERTLSRLKTTSAWGWSNFRSASANMKSPLANALPTSWFATSTSCSGSAVDAITRSTGKSPPPGSGAGVMGITRTPGISASFGETAISSSSVVRVRSLHGFITMPREAAGGAGDLEDAVRLREGPVDVVRPWS